MRQYTFFDGGAVEFDEKKSVRELIEYAFDSFDYYEPLGIDAVTVFQPNCSKTSTGWFTTDVTLSCEEEIGDSSNLCFAYHIPNVFYFAEGGWDSHMLDLGNHPKIDNAIDIDIRLDGKENTVVINGSYSFNDIVKKLKSVDYISSKLNHVNVFYKGSNLQFDKIYFSDELLDLPLTKLKEIIRQRAEKIESEQNVQIFSEVFVLGKFRADE